MNKLTLVSSLFKRALTNWKSRKAQQKPIVSQTDDLLLMRRLQGRRMPSWTQFKNITRILSPKERLLWRFNIIVLMLGMVWFGITIVSKYRTIVPTVGGSYVEGIVGSPQLINPLFAAGNDVDTDLVKLMYTSLIRYDKDKNLAPDLAESYEVSLDKKTYTFHLRKDVLWHDGERFKATDVLYTFESIQNPMVNSPLLVSFQGVAITTPDDYTVQFVLKEPFSPFLSSLADVGILPEHVWFDVTPERMYLNKHNLQPIGTGPYQFKKLVKDDTGYINSYELSRFDKFYRDPAYIQDFSFRFYSDYDGGAGTDSAIQALREQKVSGLNFVPRDLRDKVERKHINLHTFQLPQYTALFFNPDEQPILKEKSFRLALEEAIDKNRILKDVLHDDGSIISSPILAGFPGFSATTTNIAYAADEANKALDAIWPKITKDEYREKRMKELVAAWQISALANTPTVSSTTTSTSSVSIAGGTVKEKTISIVPASSADDKKVAVAVTPDIEKQLSDTLDQEMNEAQSFYRKTKSGDIVTLHLVTADTAEYKKAAELIAGFWQDIGIKTNLEFIAHKDFSRLALKPRAYDVLLYGFIIGDDPDQYPFWHSSQVDYPGLNVARYSNKTVDDLLVKARESADEQTIADLYKKIQDTILADRPAIFLYSPTYTYATSDSVYGLSAEGSIFRPADIFNNVTEWYVKTKGEWAF